METPSWPAALSICVERGLGLVIAGTPFDLVEERDEITASATAFGWHGLILFPGSNPTSSINLYVMADASQEWPAAIRQAFGRPCSIVDGVLPGEAGVETIALLFPALSTATSPGIDEGEASGVGTGLLTSGESSDAGRLSAGSIVHVQLTEQGMHLSNRTPFTVGMNIELRGWRAGDSSAYVVAAELEPGEQLLLPDPALGDVAGFDPPLPVVRQWSHGPETVYEGGQRQIGRVELRFMNTEGLQLGQSTFQSRTGLSVGVGGRQIAKVLQFPMRDAPSAYRKAGATPLLTDLLAELSRVK